MRWTTPNQWHVTLRFIGEADPEEVAAGLQESALGGPVEAVMSASGVRLGRNVLCLPVHGLEGLAAAVDPAPARPFRGHLTLARGRVAMPVALPREVRWTVEEVTLVASRLRPSGAEYEVLDRTPVR